jgi:hypothetical protein
MATQLRLVDPPPATVRPRPSRARTSSSTPARGARGAARLGARTVKGSARRAAQWGEWRLDDRTRQVGRAGIAAARAALEQAGNDESLPRAS